jgi:HEPN superfamily RiboL-PSP-like protein
MTKVRSREECLNAIQSDSSWRKKEMTALKGRLAYSEDGDQGPLLRSAMVMIYAHWEGFVKTACELYIDHINDVINRRTITLSPHFRDILMWSMFRKKGEHAYSKNPTPFLEMLSEWPCSPGELLPTDIIDTESNLNSKTLKRLTMTIGLDYSFFQTKEKLIDESLLKTRNQIAHGERIAVSPAEYETIEREIRALIDRFQQLIETCVQQEKYRVTTSDREIDR